MSEIDLYELEGKRKKSGQKVTVFSVFSMIILWKILSLVIHADIILPSPERTLIALVNLLITKEFWFYTLTTLSRGFLGFIISFFFGMVIGGIAGYNHTAGRIVQPIIVVVRATPVMSIIILALIWFKTNFVPVFAALLMAFPIITTNVQTGIQNTSSELLEMASVYRVPLKKIMKKIYLPSIYPYLMAGATTALGLTWRVVVAAEVLSQPIYGIGTGLQEAKIDLLTAKVFAWTTIAIFISALTEKIVYILPQRRFILRKMGR